jgi:hypothetical protein
MAASLAGGALPDLGALLPTMIAFSPTPEAPPPTTTLDVEAVAALRQRAGRRH